MFLDTHFMYLLQTRQGREDWQIPIQPNELMLIGRGENCAVQLDDPSISRVHCRLLVKKGIARLYDAGSRWGTYVNGDKIDECMLKPNDEIEIGESTLKFVVEDLKKSPQKKLAKSNSANEHAINSSQNRIEDESILDLREYDTPEPKEKFTGLEDFIGTSFLDYDIDKVIARTRKGVVYHAIDSHNDSEVAIKFYHPHIFKGEDEQRRFHRATNTILGLEHEHLVTLYAAGEHRGIYYTITEFIEGESVHQMINRLGIAGMLDWKNVVQIGVDIAKALCYLEEQNVIHRNLLPTNIFVQEKDKKAVLGDFLLAKPLCGEHAEWITQQDDTVGEIVYLAPEEIEFDHPVDVRTDIYHLGAMFYTLLTGQPPLQGANVPETLSKIVKDKPDSPKQKNMSIPDLLEGIIMKMLEKRPESRQENAKELLGDFQRVLKYNN